MIRFRLWGQKRAAEVSELGEVLTRPYAYSDPKYQYLDTINTAYNFFAPRPGQQFVVTMLIITTDKDVGVDGATIVLYEAAAEGATAVAKTIISVNLLKNTNLALVGMQLLVNPGTWINGKTDDDDVHLTVGGYYIPELG